MRPIHCHSTGGAGPQPPQDLPSLEQHLHLSPGIMAGTPNAGTEPHPCPSFYMTISVSSSDILTGIWQAVGSTGKPASFSSSLKVALDALLHKAMAVHSQPLPVVTHWFQ